MKKIREYFQSEIGPWADMMTDEQIDDLVANFLKTQKSKLNLEVKPVEFTEVSKILAGSGSTNINATNVKRGYLDESQIIPSVDREAAFYGANLIVKDLEIDPVKQTYNGVIVKDLVNPNQNGKPIRGYFEKLVSVDDRAVVIQNGRTIYAREFLSKWFDKPSNAVDDVNAVVLGHFTYIFDATTYKSIKWDIFPKGEMAAIAHDKAKVESTMDNKFIRIYFKNADPNYVVQQRAKVYAKAAYDKEGKRIN